MRSVGVRELRQNASQLLELVAAGERVAVTNHGHAVAHLVPVPSTPATYAALVESGAIRPGRGDILDVEPFDSDIDSATVLAELRAE